MKVRNRILYYKRPGKNYGNYDLDNFTIFSSLLNEPVTYDILLELNPLNLVWTNINYQQIHNIKKNFHISENDLRINAIYKNLDIPNYTFNTIWNFLL